MTDLFAAAEKVADEGLDTGVIAAIIAAGVSLLASGAALWSSRQARRAVERQRTQDYRVRQLNELYGPLYMRRMESLRLWHQLPDDPNARPGTGEWNLIDHIEEIKEESGRGINHRRLIVEAILEINEQDRSLIVGAAGLLERFPPPKSFETFLEHARTLKIHWEQGKNAHGVNHVPFPGEINDAIEEAITRLRADL